MLTFNSSGKGMQYINCVYNVNIYYFISFTIMPSSNSHWCTILWKIHRISPGQKDDGDAHSVSIIWQVHHVKFDDHNDTRLLG